MNDMLAFNEAISALALVEIPIKGREYTWSNMQNAPLLEKLDWVFSSESWTSTYLNTMVTPLSKPISDHTPFNIQIGTSIPRSTLFRFENYWLSHHDFKEKVKSIWEQDIPESDSAKRITAKFKRPRKDIKIWAKDKSQLASTIKNTSAVIEFFDSLRNIEIWHRGKEMAEMLLKTAFNSSGISEHLLETKSYY